MLGFTFGESGIRDGSFSSMVGDETASSATYFIGWMGGSGVLVHQRLSPFQFSSLGVPKNNPATPPKKRCRGIGIRAPVQCGRRRRDVACAFV
jgi:hypothetical protein